MFFYSVFLGIKAISCFQRNRQTIPNIWCHIRNCFLVFRKGWFSLRKDVLVLVLRWPAGLKTSFIYAGHLLLKDLKVIKLMHCSKRSFMESQVIFSNSVKPMWSLLFKFKQKRIHLFWSIRSFFFRLLFQLGYQAEHV